MVSSALRAPPGGFIEDFQFTNQTCKTVTALLMLSFLPTSPTSE